MTKWVCDWLVITMLTPIESSSLLENISQKRWFAVLIENRSEKRVATTITSAAASRSSSKKKMFKRLMTGWLYNLYTFTVLSKCESAWIGVYCFILEASSSPNNDATSIYFSLELSDRKQKTGIRHVWTGKIDNWKNWRINPSKCCDQEIRCALACAQRQVFMIGKILCRRRRWHKMSIEWKTINGRKQQSYTREKKKLWEEITCFFNH